MYFDSLPMFVYFIAFLISATCIGFFGVKLTRIASQLAHSTNIGETIMGTIFIGAATSLSGITASVVSALYGHAEFAISNASGGIAAQTSFLVLADLAYRKANLEHAAASVQNLLMSVLLILLLFTAITASILPPFSIFHVHPASVVLVLAYLAGLFLLKRTKDRPMWLPKKTPQTVFELDKSRKSNTAVMKLWLKLAGIMPIILVAGFSLTQSALKIGPVLGIHHGITGGVFAAITTSLPELIVALSAVRLGALNLAIGNIIGGNMFDTLFIAFADFAFLEGSIFNSVTWVAQFWMAVSAIMTGLLLLGLLYRQRRGLVGIGFESSLMIIVYVFAVIALVLFDPSSGNSL